MNMKTRLSLRVSLSSRQRAYGQKMVAILAMTGLILVAEADAVAAAASNDINEFLPGSTSVGQNPILAVDEAEVSPVDGTEMDVTKQLQAPLMSSPTAAPAPAPPPADIEQTLPAPDDMTVQSATAAATEPLLEAPVPTPPVAVTAPSKGYIEAGAQRYVLTGRQPSWEGEYVRGAWVQNEKNVWNYELVDARRYGDSGTFYSAGLTHTFTDDWYAAVSVGSSSGGFFWPRERIDVFIHHKFLEKKNLVAVIGYTHYQAKDSHHDQILHIGADYYFETPWIVSGEFLVNDSSPGHVKANYAFLTATYGHDKQSYLTLRVGHGKEAYQLLGDQQVISGFNSTIATLSYRKWIGKDWGVNMVGEYYTNPSYKRRGVEVGIFKDF
ncbi:YaiO family outer membrane beta-barrel protein [Glaciimonas sp. PCH181]|uniref:YaiO family outer membrane beta-barrel protein n=1 Tax=Glaciimonas sp. PCH181 TaxID=2133943 RepID=UPI000D35C240|nr:YaiO family outer membrane beta-barrel protein [Glaciimonas sp. PCH181]PUA18824.1 hypothetical protein C7W93_02610 [Glaciimonas sp. PCH181]